MSIRSLTASAVALGLVAFIPAAHAQDAATVQQAIVVRDADADVTAQVAARQLQELERQRDSVAAYLTEMRGVLGGALPQAPTFSDHVAALPQEPSPAAAPEQTSAQTAEPAASSSAYVWCAASCWVGLGFHNTTLPISAGAVGRLPAIAVKLNGVMA